MSVLALLFGLLPGGARAQAETTGAPRSATSLSYRESGCTEISYIRGGLASKVRPLVPPRFELQDFPTGLPADAPPRVYLYISEVTCERGEFDGQRRNINPYTFIIVSASVTATEGDQRDGAYVLFYASSNPAQRSALRRLGWPVVALGARTAATITRDARGNATGMALHVVGGGWAHDIIATVGDVIAEPTSSSAEFFYDTPSGPQTSCFRNLASAPYALYAGDLRSTPLATVAYVPPIFAGYPGALITGGWDVTVTSGPCPAAAAPSTTDRLLTQAAARNASAG